MTVVSGTNRLGHRGVSLSTPRWRLCVGFTQKSMFTTAQAFNGPNRSHSLPAPAVQALAAGHTWLSAHNIHRSSFDLLQLKVSQSRLFNYCAIIICILPLHGHFLSHPTYLGSSVKPPVMTDVYFLPDWQWGVVAVLRFWYLKQWLLEQTGVGTKECKGGHALQAPIVDSFRLPVPWCRPVPGSLLRLLTPTSAKALHCHWLQIGYIVFCIAIVIVSQGYVAKATVANKPPIV